MCAYSVVFSSMNFKASQAIHVQSLSKLDQQKLRIQMQLLSKLHFDWLIHLCLRQSNGH